MGITQSDNKGIQNENNSEGELGSIHSPLTLTLIYEKDIDNCSVAEL